MNITNIMDVPIGKGHPPFIIAELGICHEGKIAVALDLAKAAIEAGAHCIKTETFNHKNMVFDPHATTSYYINGKKHTVSLIDHMKQFELSLEEHFQIKKLCDDFNVPFISTAHDFKAVDFLCDIKAAGIKIASPDIVHYPLLKYAAAKKLPIIIDSGGALQYEIEMAIKLLKGNGSTDIMINHNPSGHPAPAGKHDLATIPRLQMITQLPVGLSDHYEGYEILYGATALGANILEKPISFDRTDPMPEKNWSISVPDLFNVFSNINHVYKAIGMSERKISNTAKKYRDQNRMACLTKKKIKKGEFISLENTTFGRPRKGIGVEHWDIIQGMKFRSNKHEYEFIQWNDLD